MLSEKWADLRGVEIVSFGIFELVMAGKVDISKAKPTEIINCCLKAGNIKGLQYALDQGWANGKKAMNKAADKLEIKDDAVLEWLNRP